MLLAQNSSSCPTAADGAHYIRWIHTVFGDCVYGWQDSCSVLLGYLSILCWLNAQLPQIIKNYQIQDAASLSFTFLMTWLIADIGNFIGCILTGQLDFQLYLAMYFTLVDGMLCVQWLYYVRYPRNRLRLWFNNQHHRASSSEEEEQNALLCGSEQDVQRRDTANLAPSTSEQGSSSNKDSSGYQAISQDDVGGGGARDAARTLLTVGYLVTLRGVSPGNAQSLSTTSHDMPFSAWDTDLWIGRFFGWLCAFLYLSSRVPQMYRNFRRRSAQGLSMALFLCAAAGNLTYTLGILVNPNQNRQTLLEAIPYILGSAGTLVFDVTIYIQHLVYSRHTEEKKQSGQQQHGHRSHQYEYTEEE